MVDCQWWWFGKSNHMCSCSLLLLLSKLFCEMQKYFCMIHIIYIRKYLFMGQKYFVRYLNGGLASLTTSLSILAAATFAKISLFFSCLTHFDMSLWVKYTREQARKLGRSLKSENIRDHWLTHGLHLKKFRLIIVSSRMYKRESEKARLLEVGAGYTQGKHPCKSLAANLGITRFWEVGGSKRLPGWFRALI